MAAMLLVWMGLLLGSPTLEPGPPTVERASEQVAQVRLGSGDRLGERMFSRALHRRRILLAEQKRLFFCVRLGVRGLGKSRSYGPAVRLRYPPCR